MCGHRNIDLSGNRVGKGVRPISGAGPKPKRTYENTISLRDYKPDTIPASSFVNTIKVNVDNEKMSDAQFREFIRNTLPIVE